LKGKEDVVVRVSLEHTRKKIISYQELRQITKVFGTDISKKEKEAFFLRKGGKRRAKNKRVQKDGSLPKDFDSFSFFYIQSYC